MIRDPAPKGPRQTVHNRVDSQCQAQGGDSPQHYCLVQAVGHRDGLELGDHHETPKGDQRHHHIQQPEPPGLDHLQWGIADGRQPQLRLDRGGDRLPPRRWRQHEVGSDDEDDALDDPPSDEGGLVPTAGNHPIDGENGERCAKAERARHHSHRQPSPVREPFERSAHAGYIHSPDPEAAANSASG